MTPTKNFVFISYNHQNVKWAKWLQQKLEGYRLPAEIHNEFEDSRYLRPVFRDRDTLSAGVLNDELRTHLENSKFLVVLCSPHAAQSPWVSDEVQAFLNMGRLEQIVPFIVEGSPQDYSHADTAQPLMGECFPKALREWNAQHPDKNLLGIAVTDDGKTDRQKAFIRLVSHLLGVSFDTLWQRHKRRVRRIAVGVAALAVAALLLAYWFMIPVRMDVTLLDEPSRLPGMEQGVLTVNGSEYSISHPDTTLRINALPGYFRTRRIPLHFQADRFYEEVESTLKVGMGVRQHEIVQLHRDGTFAVFAGTVYDGDTDDFGSHPVSGANVSVGGRNATTDAEGRFQIELPLDEQAEALPLAIEAQGYGRIYREDEIPGGNLTYLLHRYL